MQILRSLWLFIRDQVLGMKGLNALIGDLGENHIHIQRGLATSTL